MIGGSSGSGMPLQRVVVCTCEPSDSCVVICTPPVGQAGSPAARIVWLISADSPVAPVVPGAPGAPVFPAGPTSPLAPAGPAAAGAPRGRSGPGGTLAPFL